MWEGTRCGPERTELPSDLGGISTMEALLPASYMSISRNMLSLPLTYNCGRIESGGLSKPDRKRPPPRETRLGWFI